ncbi:LPS-assembly protein LptD [Rhizobium sp. LC145]|uniref:LPS-assembly protein LptD n=1 Tax=Rhizobium sp. LC145 TaxID=1120688 RepID=UPI000629EBC5|nr:LPS-assembly protein LptD [Rhizobium sp. LC145]KKX34387.1 Organic solvent tolerance protein [Rhizobium sp. LC145]TKT65481.1 LPS-assembly protein LptD [Rhizobiaceae bacterium LC148]
MAVSDRGNIRRLTAALLTGVAAFAFTLTTTVEAQEQALAPQVSSDAKLLLRANELVYNQDAQRVTAAGGVQIHYGGYRMVAQQVEYNQQTGRVMARGNIELVAPDGNRIYADELDVTDDFGQGFLNALRVETTDNTRLIAESAERLEGDLMVLNNGVYTACLPCAQKPGKAPLWQVKAQRVVQNGQTHTVRLEKAQFELFGMPIGYLPFIEVPDHTVERKSGFLFPRMSMGDNLGFGLTVPYYHVFSPHMDATISPTFYTGQGLLMEGEVRNRFETGEHTFRFAGINQRDPGAFNAGTADANADTRLMAASKAHFQINPRWTFGWNVMIQNDNNFSRTYDLQGYDDSTFRNEIYLTGLGERNYFDLRGYYFDVQDAADDERLERQQAIVYPSLDYHYIAPEPVAGGELSFTTNFTNLSRREDDFYSEGLSDRFRGLEGSYTRLTAEAEWKRTFTTPQGLLLTPLLAARGDLARSTSSSASYLGSSYAGDLEDGASSRYMVTAGLEARYPVLLTAEGSSHVIEPIAQVFVRPDEPLAGGLPNEDAQSFVFDATNLFDRDKFSGFDRIEGGTRANVGLRYNGSFDNGVGLRSIVGQSFHLAGQNSFATDDLVNAGANSGLESDSSDYVAYAAIDLPQGFTISASGRFDRQNFDLERADTSVSYSTPRFSGELIYTQIDAQPEYGSAEDTELLRSRTSFRINENWSVMGAATWDLVEEKVVRRGIGFSYLDECTIFSIAYEDKPASTQANDWSISARLSFRTLGDVNIGSSDLN